ncbi:transcriptional regulator [Tepidicaulis marinus]|jgi:Cu(I)-responsive transcriptional regulator|uniref:Transcriptional regulator n=1 Tax=Tepidicaulis marinus TaxID=1333998 RepID=A0A081BBE6_9HYPH|nr:Cu(I)-responsive transcriptional regulator [Tepidicaulis marinus]GAK45364.1 transcriptional regulator [Tepidicaulis marinus]
MNIGKVAELSGVPAKTIRYYESIGLTLPPARSESGYRTYAEEDVHMLKFVARARSLGFSIDDCRGLLALYRDRGRASADVKRIAEEHIGEIERKIAELQSMRTVLRRLAEKCHGDERPDCPILDELSG